MDQGCSYLRRLYPCSPSLTEPTGVLQRGRKIEAFETRQHRAHLLSFDIDHLTFVSVVEVDAMDLYDYIRRNPKANPLGPVGAHFVELILRSLPSPAGRGRRRTLLSPQPRCGSWGPQTSTYPSLQFYHRAERPRQGNIVVWPNGKTFGPAAVLPLPRCRNTADPDGGNTWPWTAPELLQEGVWCSEKSDVFAFAMVMLEVHYR